MKPLRGITVTSRRQLAALPELRHADFLELPASFADDADLVIPPAWRRRFTRAECRGEARTFSAVIDAVSGIRNDFFRVFAARCEKCAALGARAITLGIDWENLFDDPGYAAKLREVLRCCFGIAAGHRQLVLLELRTPGIAAGRPAEFRRFRDSLLYPVRTLIDLHPHEPGALEALEKFSAALPSDVSHCRISFDAAGGNYLSAKLRERITAAIRPVGAENTSLCFYPGGDAGPEVFNAIFAGD